MIARACLVIAVGACGARSTAPITPRPDPPACTATVSVTGTQEDFHVSIAVAGVDTQLAPSPDYQHWQDVKASVWAHGPHAILLAWNAPGRYFAPGGSATLYAVDCASPASPRPFATFSGANFGATALARDGRTLYVSGLGGARAVDLATRQIRVVTAPEGAPCDRRDAWEDTVVALDEDEDVLEIRRGSPCTTEGDYAYATYYVDHPGAAHPAPARSARPVGAVAFDGGGAWLVGASGALWRSADRGTTWTKRALPHDETPDVIRVDPRRADHFVVLTTETPTTDLGPPLAGGRIVTTRDGGATWSETALPDELAGDRMPDGTHWPAHRLAIALRGDAIVVWGEANGEHGDEPRVWETRDAGATWTDALASPRPERASEARRGEVVLRESPDGVVVIEGGGKPRRVYVK